MALNPCHPPGSMPPVPRPKRCCAFCAYRVRGAEPSAAWPSTPLRPTSAPRASRWGMRTDAGVRPPRAWAHHRTRAIHRRPRAPWRT
eukprot:3301870-Prymnesium_polylepis.1